MNQHPATPLANRLPGRNLLDRDGTALLVEGFLPPAQADRLLAELMTGLPWERHTVCMWGRSHPVPRLTAWYGPAAYRYSGVVHPPAPMPPSLADLARAVSGAVGVGFDSVLANRYDTGEDRVGYHSDDEPLFGPHPTIASVSLGGVRRFSMRHRQGGETVSVDLPHGSLLVMAGPMQEHWRHSVPPTRGQVEPRVNLTLRRVVPPAGG